MINPIQFMKEKYNKEGYGLPIIVFWNLVSRNNHIPVKLMRIEQYYCQDYHKKS